MIDFGKMQTTTLLAVILVGLGAIFLFGSLVNRDPDAQVALFPTPESIALDASEVVATATPVERLTTAYVSANNPMAVALSGEYGNGGVWNWEEITNLMSVYGTANTLVAATNDGQLYEGVPLAYLLDYSAVNGYADVIVITGADDTAQAYPVDPLLNCADCILAATTQNNLVVVLPGFEPRFIAGVQRLDAATNAAANETLAAAAEAKRLAENPNIRVYGLIDGPEAWTWQDVSGLLGIYDSAGNFQQRTVDGVTYEGVPVSYLMHYVKMDSTANTLQVSISGRQQLDFSFSRLDELSNLLLALAPDESFVMLAPAQQGTEVLSDLLSIRAEAVESPVTIPADPQTINLAGGFKQGGSWSWTDITNLMGVYEEYGSRKTVEVNGVTYSGVPLLYLLNYAEVINPRASVLATYNRDGLRQNMTFNTIRACVDCLIAPATDGTLTLVLPDKAPAVFPELAVLEIP